MLRLIFLLTICGFLGLFFISPTGFDHILAWACLFVMYGLITMALSRPHAIRFGHYSYINLEVLFLFLSYVIFFLPYQMTIIGVSDTYSIQKFRVTYPEGSNRALIVSTISMLSFCFGLRLVPRPFPKQSHPLFTQINSVTVVVVIVLLLLLMTAFVTFGGLSFFSGEYVRRTQVGTLGSQLLSVTTLVAMIASAIFVLQLVSGSLRKGGLLCGSLAIGWATSLLILGDRNHLLLVALPVIAGVAFYRRNIGLAGLALMMVLTWNLYVVVEFARKQDTRGLATLFAATLTEREDTPIWESSLTNSTTVTRVGINAVPTQFNFGYGKYLAIGASGVVPFLRGQIWGNDPFAGSSSINTYLLNGPNASWGVGTTLVADVYMDFGIIGVPVSFLLLGAFGGWVTRRAILYPERLEVQALLLVTTALFAQLPRYSLGLPIRYIVWTLLIFWGCRILARLIRSITDPPASRTSSAHPAE